MSIQFSGRWRGTVITNNAGFSQRVVISGASVGSGTYTGTVGTSFIVDGDNWFADLEWNNNAGSGWQPSGVLESVGMTSPLVAVKFLRGDDNFADKRDGDYDDVEVMFEHLDAPFEVTQRPFAMDRGSLIMMPDGIFDTSQGVQYMGVRIKNTWLWNWYSGYPGTGMKIGISPTIRSQLAGQGIIIIDNWSSFEQDALGQVVEDGFVRVGDLNIGEEKMIYFKIDVSNAGASKPEIGFVAQRDAWDNRYDEESRRVRKKIFISKSSYNHETKELTAEVPEGKLVMKLNKVILDRKAASEAAKFARECFRKNPSTHTSTNGSGSTSNGLPTSDELRDFIRDLLAGKDVDPCKLRGILEKCCNHGGECNCGDGNGGRGDGHDGDGNGTKFPEGGFQDGTGGDNWCRIKPVAWLPVDFEYKIIPNPAYSGQLGPLAFEDPWWKVVLIIIAILLAIASVIADYVTAAEDPQYIIGNVLRKADVVANSVDAAVANLNGTRGVDLGMLDAQSDDVNNGNPISALNSIVQLVRTDNGDSGIEDAVLGNVVWKSGGTSATTRGQVDDIAYSTSIPYDDNDFISGTVSFSNQVLVGQITGAEEILSMGGDSGSLWVDLTSGRPVALNFAGPADDSGVYGIGNPIRAVINRLNIHFNS